AQKLELSPPTVNAILNELTRDGILNEVTGASRNRVYQMTEYIRLFQDPAY
ncbi:MAG: winged helix-turn-helix transcriptional regulator, partial [Lentisphaeria bacterium]|nr:winged helix-turn-helix transcriptional regulator [Lentisphaeria bacterium]